MFEYNDPHLWVAQNNEAGLIKTTFLQNNSENSAEQDYGFAKNEKGFIGEGSKKIIGCLASGKIKNYLICLSFVLLTTVQLTYAYPCWTSSGGLIKPDYISDFSVDGDTIFYAAKAAGIFRSVNGGKDFQYYCSGPENKNITSLSVSGNTVLIGTDDSGIFLSTDTGKTWTVKNSGLIDLNIKTLTSSGSNVFTGTNKAGIFLSSDTANSWIAINNGLTDTCIISIAVNKDTVLASTQNSGLFISYNNGQHWQNIQNSQFGHIAIDNTNIYRTSGSIVEVSSDTCNTWVRTFETQPFAPNPVDWKFLVQPKITAVAVCNGKVIAGTDYGQVCSSFGIKYPNPHDNSLYIVSLTYDNKNLYADTWYGLLTSSDNGNNWRKIPSDTDFEDIKSIAVQDTIMFICSNGKGAVDHFETYSGSGMVYRSTNSGRTWSALDSPFTESKAYSLVLNGNNLFVATENNLLHSTDYGKSWTVTDSGLGNAHITALAVYKSSVYASGDSGIFQSSDTGKCWVKINTGPKDINSFIVTDSNIIAIADISKIYMLNMNKKYWILLNKGLNPPEYRIKSLAVIDTTLFVGTFFYGLFRLPNYQQVNRSIGFSDVNFELPWSNSYTTYDFAVNNGTLFAATEIGVFRVTCVETNFSDASDTINWTAVNSGLTGTIKSLTVKDSCIFASSQSGGVYISNNSGSTWNAINNGLNNLQVTKLATSQNNIVAGTSNGAFYSSNNGASWIKSSGFPDSTKLTSFATNGSCVVAISSNKNVFRSTDNGVTWTKALSRFNDTVVTSLAMIDTIIFAGTYDGVFRSTDNGIHWKRVNSGLTDTRIYSLSVVDGNLLAGSSSNIFLSKNNGESWTVTISTGYEGGANTALEVYNGFLYIGDAFTGISRVYFEDFLPVKHNLLPSSNLYPGLQVLSVNNAKILFSIALPHHEKVTLSVINLMGRETASLVNTYLNAGKHQVVWNARNNAKGYYIARLQVGKNCTVKRFMVY